MTEIVCAFVDGEKVIYVCKPGELMAMTVSNNDRVVVAHPERPPKFVNKDGSEEPIVFTTPTVT